MADKKLKKILSKLTIVLRSSLESDESFIQIIESLKELIDFDYGALYYLNSGRINLKASKNYTQQQVYSEEKVFFDISEKTNSLLFSNNTLAFDSKSPIAVDIQLDKKNADFAMAKLMIRDTVFGFIILANFNGSEFADEDIDILELFASVVSYSIKDSELSSVFKVQLKALQESIIEKTQAYKTIEEQNKKILEADKIKNDFIANISHELRTPLNAIIGFSDALNSEIFGTLNDKQQEYIADINASGVHLLGMINGILELSKIEAKVLKLNKGKFQANASIEEVLNIVSPLALKKKIKIEKSLNKNLEIKADYQKFHQILFNLMSNAIKFTPDKGLIKVSLEKSGDNVILKVQDTGIGIDEKYHDKIFDKFVQLDNIYTKKEHSTGLGLTITKELVELHGGKICLESTLGKGSTFIIELPQGLS